MPDSNDSALLGRIGELASAAPLPPQHALALYSTSLDDSDRADFETRVLAGRSDVDLPTTATARVALIRKQVNVCVAEGFDEASCCRSLVAPTFLLEEWSKLDPAGRERALAAAEGAPSGFADRLLAASTGDSSPAPEGSVFRLQGVKAWLAACSAVSAGLPRDLNTLRAAIGDYRKAPVTALPGSRSERGWTVELHPVSRAKFAGRRIYRNAASGISVAESLAADCSISETEVIWSKPGQELRFASYTAAPDGANVEYGLFPGRPGREALKFTPDSCMGCHYTFDTRRFEVRIPSFAALNLRPRVVGGVDQARDDSHCARVGERIVRHSD